MLQALKLFLKETQLVLLNVFFTALLFHLHHIVILQHVLILRIWHSTAASFPAWCFHPHREIHATSSMLRYKIFFSLLLGSTFQNVTQTPQQGKSDSSCIFPDHFCIPYTKLMLSPFSGFIVIFVRFICSFTTTTLCFL